MIDVNSPNTMEVTVSIRGTVVVDNDVDPLDIDTSTKDISGYQYTLFESLERGIAADSTLGKERKQSRASRALLVKTSLPLFLL